MYEMGELSAARAVEFNLRSSNETLKTESETHVPVLSPDGKTLAWAGPSEAGSPNPDIYIRRLDELKIQRLGEGGFPRWTPDGEALIVSRPDGLTRLSLDGASSVVLRGDDLIGEQVGEDHYLVATTSELIDYEGQERRLLFKSKECATAGFDFARKESKVAYVVRCGKRDSSEGIYTVDLNGSHRRKLISGVFRGVSWSPDERSLVAAAAPPGGGTRESELWFIDGRTGSLEAREGSQVRAQWPDWGLR